MPSHSKMLHLLVLSSLLGLALSLCSLPPAPSSAPYPTAAFVQTPLSNGQISFTCPGGYYPFGNFGTGLFLETISEYTCNSADGKFTVGTKLSTLTCLRYPTDPAEFPDHSCVMYLAPSTAVYMMMTTMDVKCTFGESKFKTTGAVFTKINCKGSQWLATYPDSNVLPVTFDNGEPQLECAEATTTTLATTTTQKPDAPASAAQLWNINYYYNYGVGVHAFCADQICINAIQSNGIGYDMVNGKGLMGKAVSESAIGSVRASCPKGSANLRNLGFTKSGNKYLHNLNGSGLKLGWVAIANGVCGASVPIKRWKSRYTDDMMYGVDLEWNTWYQGMVQDGGAVQFYLWA